MKIQRILASTTMAVLLACAACTTTVEDDGSEDSLEATTAPIARFGVHIKALRTIFESKSTPQDVADALVSSGRAYTFSLQALCRVYLDRDPRFQELHNDFKGLEDGIGQYDKWDGIYREAVAAKKDADTQSRLKKQRDDALVRFTALLTSRQWITSPGKPTRLLNIESFLKTFKWGTRAEDRAGVLESLSDELKDLKKTTYDMKVLEEGDGVHELRRDLRWVLIEELALNGMIVLKDDKEKCPIPAYAGLVNSPTSASRYVALKPNLLEPSPCKVSRCVVLAAAQAVEDLGAVKDQAEIQVNINGDADVVPLSLQPKAKAIYDGLVKNDLFGVYRAEIDTCQAAVAPPVVAPPK